MRKWGYEGGASAPTTHHNPTRPYGLWKVSLRWFWEYLDAACAADDGTFGHAWKEAGFYDADDGFDVCVEGFRVADAVGEEAIQDDVAVVGVEDVAVSLAQLDLRAQGLQLPVYGGHGERYGFDGHRSGMSKLWDEFACIGYDDEAARGGCHDFFAQECAAATFDEAQLAVDLVGPVDGQVKLRVGVQVGEGDAQAAGELGGGLRGGNGSHDG